MKVINSLKNFRGSQIELGSWGTLQAEYFVALDGLSFPLVALSVFIMLIATISSWTIDKNHKGYFILLLILNAAILGSFCALDFLLFYVFFEFMLTPHVFPYRDLGWTEKRICIDQIFSLHASWDLFLF
jgi:NADH:ubiquinone oxidoreductase subunit 4 (subunit M)